MVKRKKWDDKEDQALVKILGEFSLPYKWDVVSHQMKKKGYKKSSKQCRERWMHQLDPDLKKERWSKAEDQKIFQLHQKIGNHWKKISEHFPGRTDNQVKNNFFSLIRKSLRVACKIIGKVSNTKLINDIKPKVLSNFITQTYEVQIPAELSDTKMSHKQIVKLNEFVQRFTQKKFAEIYTSISDQDKFVIEKCVDFLLDLNNNYSDTPSRVKKIKKKQKNSLNKKDTVSKYSDSSKLKKNISMSQVTEKKSSQDNKIFLKSWTKINNDSLWDYYKDLKNSINNSNMMKFDVVQDNVACKLKMIEYVNMLRQKIQELQNKLAYANAQEIEYFVNIYQKSIVKDKKKPQTILNALEDEQFYRNDFTNSMRKVQERHLDTQSQRQEFRKFTQSRFSQNSFNNIGKHSDLMLQEFNSMLENDQFSNLMESKKKNGYIESLLSQKLNDSEYQRIQNDDKIANQKFEQCFNDNDSTKEQKNNDDFQFKNFMPS